MEIKTFTDPLSLGIAAASFVKQELISAIESKDSANIILATGASQFSFLDALKHTSGINWSQVIVFHLDEYVGLNENHPASFRKYLRERIIDPVKSGTMHYINGDAEPLEKEIERYSRLLKDVEIDIACIGIGENGHIAFNDPPVADFNDPLLIKKVKLDRECRMQQVGEGWFKDLDNVPTHALSLTIPAIMGAKNISCVVPDERKASAVKNTVEGPISTSCPASILRQHPNCKLFLDTNSSSLLSHSSPVTRH